MKTKIRTITILILSAVAGILIAYMLYTLSSRPLTPEANEEYQSKIAVEAGLRVALEKIQEEYNAAREETRCAESFLAYSKLRDDEKGIRPLGDGEEEIALRRKVRLSKATFRMQAGG
jgi:hypothetical protein